MCQQEGSHSLDAIESTARDAGPFPWHLGVCDAHCHPTDTMASITSIRGMNADTLTIMATRSQDQDLVASVAGDLGATKKRSSRHQTGGEEGQETQVVASFGWHPWFTHQLYDDGDDAKDRLTFDPAGHGGSEDAAKKAHYDAVLQPSPSSKEQDADAEAFLASLPTPIPLSSFLEATRSRLASHPYSLVGEIGLDKAFRLPRQWNLDPTAADDGDGSGSGRDEGLTPGGREGRPLSPYRVRMQHQQAVLEAQLRLAGAHSRPVSLHGVQAHGVLLESVSRCWKGYEKEHVSRRKRRLDTVAQPPSSDSGGDDEDEQRREPTPKPFPPRICLHSFSGSTEILHQWLNPTIPADVFFSFSAAVNMGGAETSRARTVEVVRQVPADKILVESDLHVAGERMDGALEWMYREVCAVRGWELDEGVATIRRNFERFIYG